MDAEQHSQTMHIASSCAHRAIAGAAACIRCRLSLLGLRRSGLVGGLTDQAIASLGNFAFNVLLARSFSEHDYGAFALILSVVLFLNTLHQAFVTFPLSVEAAAGTAQRLNYFLARSEEH